MSSLRYRSIAIPSGDVYPNGVAQTRPDPAVQATTHVGGSFFQESPGFESIRPGRHRLQKGYRGFGIHFVPHRFAEDIGEGGLPLVVDADAVDAADIAELPGSERLDDEGKATAEEDRVLIAESGRAKVAPGSVEERHAHTMDLDGVRTESRRWTTGLLKNPVDFLSDEFQRTPVKAVAIASLITAGVYVVTRDFERSFMRRKRRAGIAAAPAAAAETTGTTAATIIETPAKVVKEVASGVSEVAETVGETIEDATKTTADAAS